MNPRIGLLLSLLEQAYNQPTWHGPNLRNALQGVKLQQALWRPAENRHCIWEYALHCAYWKYMATRHISGDLTRGNFPRKPANFPAIPENPTAKAWREDLEFLDSYHRDLLSAVRSLEPGQLDQRSGKWCIEEHILGAANHDIYHAGQIRLLRRMQEDS